MADKRKPWLDYKGSLELARQAEIARNVRKPRRIFVAIVLLLWVGFLGVHRLYLYDQKNSRRIFWVFLLLIYPAVIILSIVLEKLGHFSTVAIISNLIIPLFLAVELRYVLKRVKQINQEITSHD